MSTISGIGEPGGARQLADDELRDQRLRALAGAAELEHVHARRRRPRRCAGNEPPSRSGVT